MSRKGSNSAGQLDVVMAPLGAGVLLPGMATVIAGTGTFAEPSFESANDARRSFASGEHITHIRSLELRMGKDGRE